MRSSFVHISANVGAEVKLSRAGEEVAQQCRSDGSMAKSWEIQGFKAS